MLGIVPLFVGLLCLLALIAVIRVEAHVGKIRKHTEVMARLLELHVKESAALRASQGFRPGMSE